MLENLSIRGTRSDEAVTIWNQRVAGRSDSGKAAVKGRQTAHDRHGCAEVQLESSETIRQASRK